MTSANCLLAALVALAIVANAHLGAAEYWFDICESIDKMIGGSEVAINDTEAVFDFAMQQTFVEPDTASGETNFEEKKETLFKAWDNVIHRGECSANTFDELAALAHCLGKSHLGTLTEPTMRHAKKCFKPEHFSSKFTSIFDANPKALVARNFLDSKFIEMYREENPKERAIDNGVIMPPKCCDPQLAIAPFVYTIQRNLPGVSLKTEFRKHEKLLDYLAEHLFKACDNYVRALYDPTLKLLLVENLFEHGAEEMFALMSPEVQNDLFRDHFCAMIRMPGQWQSIFRQIYNTIRICNLSDLKWCQIVQKSG